MLLQLHGIKMSTGTISLEGCPAFVMKRVLDELAPYVVECNQELGSHQRCFRIHCKIGAFGAPTYIVALEGEHTLDIQQKDEASLFHAVRKAVRAGLFSLLEATGWVQVHAGAVALPQTNDLVLFVGESGSGKTSSVLGLCQDKRGVLFVTNDRILINPSSNMAIGWPTAIGIGPEAWHRLHIHAQGHEEDGRIWYWPSQLRPCGFSMKPSGLVKLAIMPHFTLRQEEDVQVTHMTCSELFAANIRYDALSEVHHWRLRLPRASDYGSWIPTARWVRETPALQIRTSGLCPRYIATLSQEIGL